jgi:hypothetical protein
MISDLPTIVSWLRSHVGQDPSRYVRLRAGRARRTADTIWRRELAADDSPAKVAAEVIERHGALSAKDKGWLEIIERSPRSPVIDTLPLGEPSDPVAEDEPEELSKGEIVSALVSAVLSSTRQMSEENASLRSAVATKDEQILGLVQRHTELAMTAAKDGVLLQMHEQGFFSPQQESIVDRVQALLPMIQQVSPHIAAAYAAAQSAKARASAPSTPAAGEPDHAPAPEEVVDQALEKFEAIADDAALTSLVIQPVRMARLRAAAAKIMVAAATAGTPA